MTALKIILAIFALFIVVPAIIGAFIGYGMNGKHPDFKNNTERTEP